MPAFLTLGIRYANEAKQSPKKSSGTSLDNSLNESSSVIFNKSGIMDTYYLQLPKIKFTISSTSVKTPLKPIYGWDVRVIRVVVG